MLSKNAPAGLLLQLAIGVSKLTRATENLDMYLDWLTLAVSRYGPMHMIRMNTAMEKQIEAMRKRLRMMELRMKILLSYDKVHHTNVVALKWFRLASKLKDRRLEQHYKVKYAHLHARCRGLEKALHRSLAGRTALWMRRQADMLDEAGTHHRHVVDWGRGDARRHRAQLIDSGVLSLSRGAPFRHVRGHDTRADALQGPHAIDPPRAIKPPMQSPLCRVQEQERPVRESPVCAPSAPAPDDSQRRRGPPQEGVRGAAPKGPGVAPEEGHGRHAGLHPERGLSGRLPATVQAPPRPVWCVRIRRPHSALTCCASLLRP